MVAEIDALLADHTAGEVARILKEHGRATGARVAFSAARSLGPLLGGAPEPQAAPEGARVADDEGAGRTTRRPRLDCQNMAETGYAAWPHLQRLRRMAL